jgi:Uma2 family endonuclease
MYNIQRNRQISVEILSPVTEKDDRGTKLRHYQALSTMWEVVFTSQFAPHVEVYHREEGPTGPLWKHSIFGPGQAVILPSMDIEISMDEIYEGINFDEPLPEGMA